MGFLTEFKAFAMRGNVIDLAVGVVVGSAFSKIVDSLVNDILMPPLGLLLGRVDFSNLFIVLHHGTEGASYGTLDAAKADGAVTLNIGLFVNTLISFLIVAFAIFLLIKLINRLQRTEEETTTAPTTRNCPYCLTPMPIKATRCPHCTSQVTPLAVEATPIVESS